MFQKKQTLLSMAIAFTVMVLIVGVTTLPAYSQNSNSESSMLGITLHCNLNDVVNTAMGSVTFVTTAGDINLSLSCSQNDPRDRNTAILTHPLPAVEVTRIDTVVELFNAGSSVHKCEDSSSNKHVTIKCTPTDNGKIFVLLTVNFAK